MRGKRGKVGNRLLLDVRRKGGGGQLKLPECTDGQTGDADPDNVRRRVLTSQHYGELWTGYCDYDRGPGFYCPAAGDADHREVTKLRGIFLDFSSGFYYKRSMLFWINKTKEGQDRTKLFSPTRNAWIGNYEYILTQCLCSALHKN